VLGVALLVTVIGMAALMTTRLAAREANSSTDWEEAGVLAQGAVEQGMAYLNAKVTASPAAWRSAFTSYTTGNSYAFTQSAGRGSFAWAVKDELDGNFSNNYQDPFRLYGIGKVGQSTRVFSVTVVPAGTALDALRCGVHTNGDITTSGNITLGAGPLSTNGKVNTGAVITGNVECTNQSGSSGNVSGTLTVSSAMAKTMPSAGMYNVYLAKATAIPWTSLSSSIAPGLLSPTYNPYGSPNPDGVYSIAVPAGQSFSISGSRIKGTLVISMTGGTFTLTGPILWEPNRADYPILVFNGSSVSVSIAGSTTWLSESTVGIDLNGNGNTTDDLPPQFRGLMHIIGGGNSVTVNGNAFVKGSLIVDGSMTTSGQSSYISDPTLTTRPPIGYGRGDQLMIVPGSWVWDSTP
jgi:hypothetical protein